MPVTGKTMDSKFGWCANMKKVIALVSVLSLVGCGQVDNVVNGFKSTTGMLDRTITLYADNGAVIKQWETKNMIEYSGSLAAFVDKNGNNVRISGTFIIEGK